MRKYVLVAGILGTFLAYTSCSGDKAQTQALEQRISDLEKNAYTPGLGEFMNTIQLHHAKLWFEGNDQSWPLAQYETDEMKETFDDLQKYVTNRPETKLIPMIRPALDSMDQAIASKDVNRFRSAYLVLTSACNNCHHAANHAFNVITVPTQPPVTDQQFGLGQKK